MPDDVASDQGVAMGEQWGPDMKAAVDGLKESARITLGDLHLDAKLFPHLHPHGLVLSEQKTMK